MNTSTIKSVRHEQPLVSKDAPGGKVVRPMDAKDGNKTMKQMKKNSLVILTVYTVLIVMGLGTGYLLATRSTTGSAITTKSGSVANSGKVVGVQDASKYTNCPTGKVETGGLDGEGTHHLTREGGPSQTAYLVSSLIDLDQYVGLTVKVCGQTMQAQKAPWLMDVERLEVQ